MQTNIIAGITKDIRWAHGEWDVSVIVDGERVYLGSTTSRLDAEDRANSYAFDYLTDSNTPETAAELLMQVAA
jgi:hypothetical protein